MATVNSLIFVFNLVTFIVVEPRPQEIKINLTDYESENDGHGFYQFRYETSDGASRSEQGDFFDFDPDNELFVVNGKYSVQYDNRQKLSVIYGGDNNGFVAKVSFGVEKEEKNESPLETISDSEVQRNVGQALIVSLVGGGLG